MVCSSEPGTPNSPKVQEKKYHFASVSSATAEAFPTVITPADKSKGNDQFTIQYSAQAEIYFLWISQNQTIS